MPTCPAIEERTAQGVVEIVGPDLDRALAFYTALDFCVERRTGDFAVVNRRGCRLFLVENRNAPTGKRWTNLRIVVDDVDAVWMRANELGLPIVVAIGDRPYGLRDFTLADPSGFEIRFAQPI